MSEEFNSYADLTVQYSNLTAAECWNKVAEKFPNLSKK
jgi:hypothetical protein